MDEGKVNALLDIATKTAALNDLSAIRAKAYDELREINGELKKEADERKKAENERINAERAKVDTGHIENKNPPERVDLDEERRIAEEKQAPRLDPLPVKTNDSGQGQPTADRGNVDPDREPARPAPATPAIPRRL